MKRIGSKTVWLEHFGRAQRVLIVMITACLLLAVADTDLEHKTFVLAQARRSKI